MTDNRGWRIGRWTAAGLATAGLAGGVSVALVASGALPASAAVASAGSGSQASSGVSGGAGVNAEATGSGAVGANTGAAGNGDAGAEGTVRIELPVYGRGGTTHPREVAVQLIGGGSLKSGSQRVVVVGQPSQVTAWYRAAMRGAGYTLTSDEALTATGIPGRALMFERHNRMDTTVEIDVTQHPRKPRDTVIEYWVAAVIPNH